MNTVVSVSRYPKYLCLCWVTGSGPRGFSGANEKARVLDSNEKPKNKPFPIPNDPQWDPSGRLLGRFIINFLALIWRLLGTNLLKPGRFPLAPSFASEFSVGNEHRKAAAFSCHSLGISFLVSKGSSSPPATYAPMVSTPPPYIHTYRQTNRQTYRHTYINPYLHVYIPSYIPAYLHKYKDTYMHTYVHTFLPTYIPAYLHT